MSYLARVLEFLTLRQNADPRINEDVANEVSEYEGTLLVRLGRGSAMQLRLQVDGPGVLFRIVPISSATRLEGDSLWNVASDSQLRAWLRPDSAIGAWLLAQDTDRERFARQLEENACQVTSASGRSPFLAYGR